MAIPNFNVDGVIPPYVGPNGPGGALGEMSPYAATCLEIVQTLGSTPHRLTILLGWLNHRTAIRAAGFVSGYQWLDGSFLEQHKVPNDLDLVLLIERPAAFLQDPNAFIQAHGHLIDRVQVKAAYNLDLMMVDLNAGHQSIVTLVRYYFGLFSHRRQDDLWKGMLEVNLNDPTEANAMAFVVAGIAAAAPGAAAGP